MVLNAVCAGEFEHCSSQGDMARFPKFPRVCEECEDRPRVFFVASFWLGLICNLIGQNGLSLVQIAVFLLIGTDDDRVGGVQDAGRQARSVFQLDLSRLRSGLSTHLGGPSFECQGAFAPGDE